jgi:ubiquinone/menaquinone biosynthesis C-methylase UbiE
MDTAEEARDYDAMDHSEVNHRFAADLLRIWDTETPILDVGTGTAQIPIEVCRQCRIEPPPRGPLRWDSLHIVAVDLADHMLALARRNVVRSGYTDRITVEKADAKRFNYPDGHFGAVISNSIIHHIPDPFRGFVEMHRVSAVGGLLFVRDLLRPDDEATLMHLVDTYTRGANQHQRRMFADSLRAALTVEEVRELVGRLAYPSQAVQQTSDRHWTFCARRP